MDDDALRLVRVDLGDGRFDAWVVVRVCLCIVFAVIVICYLL